MVRFKLLAIFFLCSSALYAQTNQYFVSFKDKTGTPFTITSPALFLSQRSLSRREKQNISITEEDLPVNPTYVALVKATGAVPGISSRWFNGVLVEADEALLSELTALSCVSKVELVSPGGKNTGGRIRTIKQKSNFRTEQIVNQFQLEQLGIDKMHKADFRGEGILIAIFDSGFLGADIVQPFAHIISESRIKQTYNFVNNSSDVFLADDHGTEVFSVIGAYSEDAYTGGAFKADFALYLTEDITSEYRVEEYNWTLAAEKADSAGVDIINASLGYNEFDDPAMDYKKTDLDGKTAVVTKAARKAINKGMMVVCSAGNEGNKFWKLVTPPADAEGVLAVGSVNSLGSVSSFSSVGPSADGRIKPDVMAIGSGTSVIKFNGTNGAVSGTSVASPLIASLAAGVWQANPTLTVEELYQAIIHSASLANEANNQAGYGIPHFVAIENYLKANPDNEMFRLYPNPVSNETMFIHLKEITSAPVAIVIYDSQGRVVEEHSRRPIWLDNPFAYDVTNLLPGLYLMRLTDGVRTHTIKFVKQ